MMNSSKPGHPFPCVNTFQDLVSTPFQGARNAVCWNRTLTGNFAEIVSQVVLHENIVVLDEEELSKLYLSEEGELARKILLYDLELLKAHGASPTLNIIRCYERDDVLPFFATDVYSFHVDRSPVPTDTFLCTYFGEPSEILLNDQARQKVLVPEIRAEINKLYDGAAEGFESFMSDHFFDLHYMATPAASPVNLGLGNLWRLAVDHPLSQVPPCVHRAPKEKDGQHRLLMIC